MAKQRPRPNAKDAHLDIDKDSPTWREVRTYCLHAIARASGVLEDPGSSMVDIRVAQGDKRTALGLLRLANPGFKPEDPSVPEDYPTGGPD